MNPSLRNKEIAIIGPLGAICGVAEYQREFGNALARAGHAVTHIANRFCSAYPSNGCDHFEGERLFDTGHAGKTAKFDADAVTVAVARCKARVVYLNYQDYLFPDKAGLYRALGTLAARGVSLMLLTHDTCWPANFPFHLFRGIFVHSQAMVSARFPTAAKVAIVPQGVPVFPPQDRVKLRENLALCAADNLMVSSFGLGRALNKEILAAANQASKVLALPEGREIQVQMLFAREEDFQQANEDFGSAPNVWLNGGYMEAGKLAQYLQAGDAVVLNYPQVSAGVTSSALRFALGAGCLVFARDNNWVADVRRSSLFIPFDSVNSLATQLAATFGSANARKAAEQKVARFRAGYVKEYNWDAIVAKHHELWRKM